MRLFHIHHHSSTGSASEQAPLPTLVGNESSRDAGAADTFCQGPSCQGELTHLGDHGFQLLSPAECIRFEQRWKIANTRVIFPHRSRMKDEYFRNYLVIAHDYLAARNELDFMVNGINAGELNAHPEKIATLKSARLRESKLREAVVNVRMLGSRLGIDKRFREDLSERKVHKKKLHDLGLECFHPRLVQQQVEASLKSEYVLSLQEIHDLLSSLSYPATPQPPQSALPDHSLRFVRRRRLRPLPQQKIATPLLPPLCLNRAASLTPCKKMSEHDRAIWSQLKQQARLTDLLRVLDSSDSLRAHAGIIRAVKANYAEELQKFESLASTFLTMYSLRISRPGYRLVKRHIDDEAKRCSRLMNEKWALFDRELASSDDYLHFNLYLKIFENFDLDGGDRFSTDLHSFENEEQVKLFTWAQSFKNIDRLSEIAQTEFSFRCKIQKIIHTLSKISENIELSECEKISIEQLSQCFREIELNSGVLISELETALKASISTMTEEAARPARVAASLKLFARARNPSESLKSSEQLLKIFATKQFSDVGEGFARVLSYRHAWKEISEQHKEKLRNFCLSNSEDEPIQEVLGKEHLCGEIFSPVQMRAGRYALILNDCKFPDIPLAQSALSNARALADQANRAVLPATKVEQKKSLAGQK